MKTRTAMSAVSQRYTRLPPILWMSISTTAPDRRRLGGEKGINASTSASSRDVSRMFGTFTMRSLATRFASANAPRKYSMASFGITGHGVTFPPSLFGKQATSLPRVGNLHNLSLLFGSHLPHGQRRYG